MEQFSIKLMQPNDDVQLFKQVAQIHKEEIKKGFLAKLGSTLLIRIYRQAAKSPNAFVIIAEKDGVVYGFLAGSKNTGKFYKDFIRSSMIQVMPVMIPRMFSLKTVKHIAETLAYPSKKIQDDIPKSEIMNFCISSRFQRMGLGKILFDKMMEQFAAMGIRRIKIVTGENQVSAQKFYEKLNAKKVGELEIHQGMKSFVYTYEW